MAIGQQLDRFVPRHALEWRGDGHQSRTVAGTLVFVDISGFTNLSERLAALGRVGAEELTEVLNRVFGSMLDISMARGGTLLKFGGDALLLLFEGDDHPISAASAAVDMRAALRKAVEIPTSVGKVALRMSIGVHTGEVHLFNAAGTHDELIVAGSVASHVTDMEGTASAGEIVVSTVTRDLLPAGSATEAKGDGWLLRWRTPRTALPTEESRRDTDPGLVPALLPTALRTHLTETRTDSEHRLATVAFVKFSGTDDLIDSVGGTAAAEVIGHLISSITSIADEEGISFLATDVDHDSGKVILVSGVPMTQEDEDGRVLRAVRAICDIETPLELRLGVNRGHVFAGEIGSSSRSTYTIIGDPVNLAARLMAAAPAGSIYAAPIVLNGSRTLFVTEALEPFHVKGKEQPVHAFSVGEETGSRQSHASTELPFTGRDDELMILREAVQRAQEGTGSSISVVGPTGIGKSRLVDEALADTDILTFEVRAEPYGTANPYRPLRDPAREILGIKRADNDTMAATLMKAVGKLTPHLLPLAPLLGDVAHIDAPPTPESGAIEPRFRQNRVIDVLIDFITSTVTEPFVVVAEDQHWADESTAAVFTRMERETEHQPWLLIRTSRDASEETRSKMIALDPLRREDITAIVNTATEASPLRPQDVATLVERSGGNPLFTEEILKAVRDTGSIASLPNSLDGVVGSQIDALDPASRRILRYVSVLGRSFRTSAATDLIATQGITLDDTAWATLNSFLDADGPDRFQFRHAMVRDVAYEGMPFRTRQELHLGAGEIVLRRAKGEEDTVADILGMHFFLGGDSGRAWEYCRLAGDRNMEAYANVEAATQFERAAEAGRKIESVDDAERREVWIKLGDVRERSGRFESSLDAYRRATQLTGDDNLAKAEVLLKRARAKERAGSYSSALAETTRARVIAESIGTEDSKRLLAHILGYAALVRQAQQKPRQALELANRAAEVSEAADDEVALARAWRVMDWAYLMLGDPEQAVYSLKALEVYQRIGDLDEEAGASTNLGIVSYLMGDWERAIDFYSRGREASEQVGNLVDSANAAANIGEVYVNQGRYELAEEPLRDARRIWIASGFSEGVAFTDLLLGRMYGIEDNLVESEEALEESIEESETLGLDGWRFEASIHLADAKCRAGSPETGLAIISEAEQSTPADYRDYYALLVDRIRGSILNSAGRTSEAIDTLERAIAVAADRGETFEKSLLILTLARVAPDRTTKDSRSDAIGALRALGVRSAPGISFGT